MCSFIVTSKILKDLGEVNYFTKFRGPDATTTHESHGFSFLHNLLSITGDETKQPFDHGDVVYLYNGEIYNYDSEKYNSDGVSILDKYKEYGESFAEHLDGEYAIVLIDKSKDIILSVTDTFRTKPLWYSSQDHSLSIASYKTPLVNLECDNITSQEPNTVIKWRLSDLKLLGSSRVHTFDLNQHKDHFCDWRSAFSRAIKKRTQNLRENCFIGLSSGYDSGAIACELLKQEIEFKGYTLVGRENQKVLADRSNLLRAGGALHDIDMLTDDKWRTAHEHIERCVEDFKYTIHSSSSDYNEYWLSLKDDNGSNGLSYICSLAKKNERKIYISGQGADEIFSDYGYNGVKKYKHSNFGGLFPNDLESIFPWASFFKSSMESYLAKEEYVAGSYGIEARYPFLDRDVVQEFLWLTPKLKNQAYKSVLDDYLSFNKFPYSKDEKIGF
jgi:asparagine synthetase B (glutamine-hydrolysing)